MPSSASKSAPAQEEKKEEKIDEEDKMAKYIAIIQERNAKEKAVSC